jgi:DNA-directed RNA polymerase specialized sigma24 family protein
MVAVVRSLIRPGADGGDTLAAEEQGSITHWTDDLKGGEDSATERLWGRYFDRLARLARERLRAVPRTVADEEDIALSAFDSFFTGVERGRFPQLEDRDDLWGILATIAKREAADYAQRLNRQKRGGGRILDEAALAGPVGEGPGIDAFAGAEPTPDVVAATTEEVRRLFGLLPDEPLRVIALLKMEGHTNDEIASRLDCALRSVERKLECIRNLLAAGGSS